MKLLVTGGAGFIGNKFRQTHLMEAVEEKGGSLVEKTGQA